MAGGVIMRGNQDLMAESQPTLMPGLMRVIYGIAVAGTLIALLVGSVTSFYKQPQSGSPPGAFSFEDPDEDEYQRNLGGILSVLGIVSMSAALAGIRGSLNPLRGGLLFGGAIVLWVGLVFGAGGSDDWLVTLWSGLAFVALLACARWLDDGHPSLAIGKGR